MLAGAFREPEFRGCIPVFRSVKRFVDADMH